MKAEGLEEPGFDLSEDWFTVIFRRLRLQRGKEISEGVRGGVFGGVSGGVNTLLNYIKQHPGDRVVNFEKALGIPRYLV